jgi:hypothetical protein
MFFQNGAILPYYMLSYTILTPFGTEWYSMGEVGGWLLFGTE